MAPVSHVTTSTQDEDASRKSKAANCVTSFSPDASLLRAVSPIDDVPKEERHEQIPSASLYRSSWALFLVTAYSALAIFAWSILCILTYRPLTTEHYRESALLPYSFDSVLNTFEHRLVPWSHA